MDKRSACSLLRVSETATEEDIKWAYVKLLRRYPSGQRAMDVQQAYEFLTCPEASFLQYLSDGAVNVAFLRKGGMSGEDVEQRINDPLSIPEGLARSVKSYPHLMLDW